MKQVILHMLLQLTAVLCFSQEDYGDCKDHPMFNRMPNTYITECTQNFAQMDIQTGESNWVKKEGQKTQINYAYNTDLPGTAPSFFQIVKNYEAAIAKYRGKKLYYSEGGTSTLYFKTAGKEVWIVLEDWTGTNGNGNFGLNILVIEEMKQEIKANAMLDSLNAKGFIALYINFETAKSDIKPESQNIIDQIAEMLASNPSLSISIEGHTDNVGSPASNQTLSEKRAAAVVAALVKKGIEKGRLASKGWGQSKPIADNATADGKALNRRVEIVKK